MEEDKLRDIFQSYTPSLTDSRRFMAKLEERMALVEMIKRQNEELRRYNRLSIIIAAVTGFISGVVFTLLMPWLGRVMGTCVNIFSHSQLPAVPDEWIMIIMYGLAAACTIWVSISAYNISLKAFTSAPKRTYQSL